MSRVVVSGIGVIAPNAVGKSEFFHALVQGKSGVGPVTLFDASELPVRIAGEVGCSLQELPGTSRLPSHPRPICFALSAAHMAVEDAGIDFGKEDPPRVGVVLGSTTNRYALREEEYQAAQQGKSYALGDMDFFLPGRLAEEWGIAGPLLNIDMACSSGNQAVLCARDLIRSGRADVIVTGGVDTPINLMVFSAFCQIRAMSRRNDEPQRASRPFDRQRDGLILSEGAGILVLESLDHARKRGARIYAEIIGSGLTSDAYHMLIPDKSGEQMYRAMKLALMDAHLVPEDVDYINAHGTSTRLNDQIESHAIARLFNAAGGGVPVSSIKSMIGHTLGAAGAIELVACLLSMEHSVLPPTINLEERDAACAELDYVPLVPRECKVTVCMNNSFAFGGSNSSVVLRRFEG